MRRGRDGQEIRFSFEKKVSSPDDGRPYTISVDFLTCDEGMLERHRHRTVQPSLPARVAKGCELAFAHHYPREMRGLLPENGTTVTKMNVLDLAGCIGMKGIVLGERYKEKDAYDIFTVISQCLSGPCEVSSVVRPFMEEDAMRTGIRNISDKFRSIDSEGASWVGNFLHGADLEQKKRTQAECYVVIGQFLEGLAIERGKP